MSKGVIRWAMPLTAVACGIAVGFAIPSSRKALVGVIHPGWNAEHRFTMPNGWRITEVGDNLHLPGDMPANIRILDAGKRALINTCGAHDHSLNLIDLESGKLIRSVPFKRSWVGLGLLPNGEALVSGGQPSDSTGGEAIHEVSFGGDLQEKKGFVLPGIELGKQFVSSILPGPKGILVLNIQTDKAMLLDSDHHMLASTSTGYRPYGAALSPDGSTFAITNWGDKSVLLLDSSTLEHKGSVETRAIPSSVLYAPDGRLFVSESGSNTVAVISDGTVKERIRTGIEATVPIGATPVGLALSPDSKTLYVANAGNNCVTVVDVSRAGSSTVKGLIPTDRYPTSLAVTPDGKRLLVTTAKGFYGANPVSADHAHEEGIERQFAGPYFKYIAFQLEGRLAMIKIPDRKTLKDWTMQCYENRPRGMAAAPSAEVRSAIQHGAFDKIKHVIYVIKENRAYDQVLGDIGKGESDPSLTLFGQKVTPNIHKLANTFTLFDNLYTDGEVSQAGHQWTDAGYANDYNEHQWILSYSGHGEVESDARLSSSPGEYIWTMARKHGLQARVFGEYVNVQEDHDSLQVPEIKADPEKFGFSAAFEKIFARGGRDIEKVDEFVGEMKEAEKKGKWPSLMVMALPEDHTRGMSAGALSPYAMVGDNDKAVGTLVDEVSKSPFWKDTAIFVIEDDAQNGADHIDSHRTEGLVVSPYIKRGNIDSTMYSTASMLHTMELILHLPPMTQYDQKATPMYAAFTDKPSFEPYELAPPGVDLNEKNPAKTKLALRSSKLDFSDIDKADPDEFNRILWEAYRPREAYPANLR